ncbi:hypothetical protein T492DRAFT_892447 [Pavlovales sp. CCMP2436]|nr:hypothetical protein T492DRAFT_892447 [Pavlovales sp. CCMP2436]
MSLAVSSPAPKLAVAKAAEGPPMLAHSVEKTIEQPDDGPSAASIAGQPPTPAWVITKNMSDNQPVGFTIGVTTSAADYELIGAYSKDGASAEVEALVGAWLAKSSEDGVGQVLAEMVEPMGLGRARALAGDVGRARHVADRHPGAAISPFPFA